MLRVKTFVAPSPGRGLGLFAAEPIKAGTVTWKYDADYDPSFTAQQLAALPIWMRHVLVKYGYFDQGGTRLVVPLDDLRFINHSEFGYNIDSEPDRDVARRDLAVGEELLCNYRHYEPNYFERRGIDPAEWV